MHAAACGTPDIGCSSFVCAHREAADKGDVVVLPQVWEGYKNITHQSLEMCRMMAADPLATHLLKVDDDSYVRVNRLASRLRRLPRQQLFLGWIENPGRQTLNIILHVALVGT